MLKPNKIKLLLALSVILTGIGLTVTIVLKTHRSSGPVQILKQLPKNVDISLQKIHYTDTKDGRKRWELIAEKVEYDKIHDLTLFTDVKMDIYSKGKSDVKLTLTAQRANYDNNTGDVEAEGNVTVVNEAGMRLETEHLRYKSSSSRIDTQDVVKIIDGKLTVEGTGMILMLKEKNARILRDVTAHIGGRSE